MRRSGPRVVRVGVLHELALAGADIFRYSPVGLNPDSRR